MRRIRFRRSSVSGGVASLSQELASRGLNSKLIRLENSNYSQRQEDVVINWGTAGSDGLNPSHAVAAACNKRDCLHILRDNSIPIPDFTNNRAEAGNWIDEGSLVVCRTLLRGSAGNGIIIAEDKDSIVDAPLYTRYIKKRHEYRVHVFNGEVIDVQRKARSSSVEDADVDWRVRTHDNGFVFVREDVDVPQHVKSMCIDSVAGLGLHFGAVDIVHNERQNQFYVLEINTAPGLEGQTIISYADAIQRMAQGG